MPPPSTLHIVPAIGRGGFGLGNVAVNLAKQQNALHWSSKIWCIDSRSEVEWATQSHQLNPAWARRFPTAPLLAFAGFTPAIERAARATSAPSLPAIIHQHNLWLGLSRVTNTGRERHHIQTVVAAHGALQPWALRKSSWKKRLAYWGYERANLHRAACLHACGVNEIADYRNFSLRNPIALLPNAVSSQWIESTGDANRFRSPRGIPPHARLMLYLSRITPKKGLLMLLQAMAESRALLANWILLIGGVNELGHQRDVEAAIAKLELGPPSALSVPSSDRTNAMLSPPPVCSSFPATAKAAPSSSWKHSASASRFSPPKAPHGRNS